MMRKLLVMTAVALMTVMCAQAQKQSAPMRVEAPAGLSIDNDYTPSQAGYYYANLAKGQNKTVTLTETNLTFKVYDHGGKNGYYSSAPYGSDQSITFNAPAGCVFVVTGTILGIEGFAGDVFELYDGQNKFYSYNEDDYVDIGNHTTSSNSLKVRFNTPQATSCPGFELTVRVWDQYTEVSTASELTSAVADGALIRLANNITLPAYLSIGNGVSQTVNLDLNGHTLSRNLSAADANGHVIEVHSQGILNLMDSSGDNSGKISGGWANNGGGICNYGTLNFKGGTITGCKAAQQGGGIKNNENSTLTITGGVITGNSAPNGGGIYNIEGGIMTIEDCTISSNTASADGGGIVNRGTASINNASIYNNTAAANGGGVWSNGTMTVGQMVSIIGNSALNGGGFFLTGGSNAILSGTTIRDNTSTVAGGILMDQGTVTSLTDCTITRNNATVYGGGGIVNYGNLTLNGSSIMSNSCAGQGGGLWSNGTVNMQGTVTIQNNATNSGLTSNVYLKSGHVINITDNLYDSQIGLTMEGDNGVATSGLSSYGSLDNFTNDRATIANLNLVEGEAKITLKGGGTYYIERGWDSQNKKVTETLRFTTGATRLTNTDSNQSLSVAVPQGQEKWYCVEANNIQYDHISVPYNVHAKIILCDGAYLNAVVYLHDDAQLSIYGQTEGTGTLEARIINTSTKAGIGCVNDDEYGTFNLHGGTVIAQGGKHAAGIGGGSGMSGLDVNVYGGSITATGGEYGAGIGSGYRYDSDVNVNGGNIFIYGGRVEAHGGDLGAGIGGGDGAYGGNVNIFGGDVYAYGGNDAAGIGSGQDEIGCGANGGRIIISGGHVRAYGNDVAAGIGAGEDADMGIIQIDGGIVEAHGGGGESWANAINTDDDNSGVNSITLGSGMMVTSERDFTTPERYDAVKGRKDVIIQPCPHNGATFSIDNGLRHHPSCVYCDSPRQLHTFDSFNECTACHMVSLGNNTDNFETISHWKNNTKSFALTSRVLYKDNTWNTLCLPFELDNLTGTPLEGATVKTLESATFDNGTLTLNFTTGNLNAIEAGKPYIVKWTTESDNIANPLFRNVTINRLALNHIRSTAVDFIGLYAPYSTGGEDKTMLYLGADNHLYYPNGDMTIGAFRAYFQLADDITAGATIDPQSIQKFVLNFGEGETTGITSTDVVENTKMSDAWYDLSGRKLSGVPTQKGIYIHHGRKIAIK